MTFCLGLIPKPFVTVVQNLVFALGLCTVAFFNSAFSSAASIPADMAQLCEDAAMVASQSQNVPLDVLLAVTLTETGRAQNGRHRPWPWTVNMEGKGLWFASRDQALAYVQQEYARGARSFDIGCFQINHKWHKSGFASFEAMFDPQQNANYAAAFLRDLHQEKGTWAEAAGAYHSRTEKYAKKYMARFSELRAGLGDQTAALRQPTSPTKPTRENRFPLFVERAPGRMGSLFALSTRSNATGLLGH